MDRHISSIRLSELFLYFFLHSFVSKLITPEFIYFVFSNKAHPVLDELESMLISFVLEITSHLNSKEQESSCSVGDYPLSKMLLPID